MSYYDNQSWPSAPRPQAWEQATPPPRSGASSVTPHDPAAFSSQIEEIERAIDNLVKSGKMFNGQNRRDSLPHMGGMRPFNEFDPRMGGGSSQRHSVSDFDPMRSNSASNLQNFYATQRYQPRPGEGEAMIQAKRRMAAQRERELRNYHQEQQYNRTLLSEMSGRGPGSDRTMSPSGMSEQDRRELIARQHQQLYSGNGGFDDSGSSRPMTQGSNPTSLSGRGNSPPTFGAFGPSQSSDNSGPLSASEQGQIQQGTIGSAPNSAQPQQRSRANSTSSPSSNPNSGNNSANNNTFSLFDGNAQKSSRTSTSSPGGSPPRQSAKSGNASVAPIGTRPGQTATAQGANPALNKRSTPPIASPLGFGFGSTESANAGSSSTAHKPTTASQDANVGLAWPGKSGGNSVWGGKNPLGVQASVWG